jgi:hypothetical protein
MLEEEGILDCSGIENAVETRLCTLFWVAQDIMEDDDRGTR